MALARAHKNLPILPVSRETVQDHVYRRIKELILNGEIEPGRTVTIQSIADAFEVSAMPVREALHRLVAEKALTVVAGRSLGIPSLTVDRLEDLRRVRCEVEAIAAEWAAQTISTEELDHLGRLIEQMSEAEVARERRKYVRANHAFHFTIYRASGSDALLSIIESLWLQIGPYINLLNATTNWWASNVKHMEMRDALTRKDGAAARQALQADIESAALALRAFLIEQEEITKNPPKRRGRAGARQAE